MSRTYFRLDSHKMLDALLDKAQISNITAGQACGHVDGSYISRLRNGHRKSATATTARRLAELLGVEVADLFTEHDSRDGSVVAPGASSRRKVSKAVATPRQRVA